ncbi:hypothetical protein ANANG_G00113040 [Anguilla anguilla]|uniref:Uncharacterized protein n=1 Tax=Anguilla anguilla TaxID=7936 RepID=A0A9D3MKP0_ANGAN|nr:hypothetical protein ANANG_G00113040 [Anguilla anguilla]
MACDGGGSQVNAGGPGQEGQLPHPLSPPLQRLLPQFRRRLRPEDGQLPLELLSPGPLGGLGPGGAQPPQQELHVREPLLSGGRPGGLRLHLTLPHTIVFIVLLIVVQDDGGCRLFLLRAGAPPAGCPGFCPSLRPFPAPGESAGPGAFGPALVAPVPLRRLGLLGQLQGLLLQPAQGLRPLPRLQELQAAEAGVQRAGQAEGGAEPWVAVALRQAVPYRPLGLPPEGGVSGTGRKVAGQQTGQDRFDQRQAGELLPSQGAAGHVQRLQHATQFP